MMRLLVVGALLSPSLALAKEPPRADVQGAPDAAPLVGRVLVWVDAPLYLSPDDTSKPLRLATQATRKGRNRLAMPMKVIGPSGAFVEVEVANTKGFSESDCAAYRIESGAAVLRVFVKRADLAPVVTRKESVTFPDGSAVHVEPGLPVERLADGRVAFDLRGTAVAITLPDDAVGYSYLRAPALEDDARPRTHTLTAKEITVGDTRVKLGSTEHLPAVLGESEGVTQVPVNERCAHAVVRVPAATVRPYREKAQSGILGALMGGLATKARWVLPEGTRLTVAGAKATAVLRYELEIKKAAAGAPEVCVSQNVRVQAEGVVKNKPRLSGATLTFCAPASAAVFVAAAPDPFGSLP